MRRLPSFCAALAVAMLAVCASVSAAEPVITLNVPPYATQFANFSSVVLPASGYTSIEVALQDALAGIQASTVRVTLNGIPMTPFVSVNMMPNGVRVIIRLGVSLNPDYSIRREGESILTFAATDLAGTAYRGQFYVSIDAAKSQPEPAKTTRARTQESTVIAPPQHFPPAIDITSKWSSPTSERTLFIEATIKDPEGIRRVVIEVNGKDTEEVLMQNERPVRYQNGRMARGAIAGDVSGVGTALRLNVPVRLAADRLNVVAIRAENMAGLGSRSDVTVQVLPK